MNKPSSPPPETHVQPPSMTLHQAFDLLDALRRLTEHLWSAINDTDFDCPPHPSPATRSHDAPNLDPRPYSTPTSERSERSPAAPAAQPITDLTDRAQLRADHQPLGPKDQHST